MKKRGQREKGGWGRSVTTGTHSSARSTGLRNDGLTEIRGGEERAKGSPGVRGSNPGHPHNTESTGISLNIINIIITHFVPLPTNRMVSDRVIYMLVKSTPAQP